MAMVLAALNISGDEASYLAAKARELDSMRKIAFSLHPRLNLHASIVSLISSILIFVIPWAEGASIASLL